MEKELYKSLKAFNTDGWDGYRPNRWVSHCTITLIGEDYMYEGRKILCQWVFTFRQPEKQY